MVLPPGRFDRGPAANALWFAEVEEVAAALDALHVTGDVLELASGTGSWIARLVGAAHQPGGAPGPTARHRPAHVSSPAVSALGQPGAQAAPAVASATIRRTTRRGARVTAARPPEPPAADRVRCGG